MKISVLVPDRTMIVDGVAREIDVSGLDPDLRIIQFENGRGHLEYYSTRRTVKIEDWTPYEFLQWRWQTAEITPLPPLVPTKDELFDQALQHPAMKAIILELAKRAGLADETALRQAIKARL